MVQITNAPSLASLTSLHLGGQALALVTFASTEELEQLPDTLSRLGGMVKMLGGGTNILAGDGVLPLVLVRCALDDGPCVIGAEGDLRFVRVGAGLKLPRLLAWCAKQGLSGLEGMAGVPGDVGGAVAGNAGAHGVDMGSVLHAVDIFTPQAGVRTFARSEVCSAYRSFSVPQVHDTWFAICSVVLALRVATPASILKNMHANIARKLTVQPVRSWSAGCIFKNPLPEVSPLSAGKLLDEAGFRGKRLGGMCFSDRHANFLVNEGKGNAQAAFELVLSAQQTVRERFGVTLETEVKLWVF